jgi:hypothetical protein
MSNDREKFTFIESTALYDVNGGAARVASGGSTSDSNDQLLTMLTGIASSIKNIGAQNNGGGDMMQMMMMMMMMGGMGGGGGGGGVIAAPPPPPPPGPTYVEVNASGGGMCRPMRMGKKGW